MDQGFARVEVHRSPGDGERVDRVGIQRRVDHGQPSALAVTDKVDATTLAGDGIGYDFDVLLDGGVLGRLGRALPVERQDPCETGIPGRLDLTLLRVVVDDARVVPGLRRQEQRRDRLLRDSVGEVPQPRDRPFGNDRVLGRPPRRRTP